MPLLSINPLLIAFVCPQLFVQAIANSKYLQMGVWIIDEIDPASDRLNQTKWYFYEQILRIPVYVIFHPQIGVLEVYLLEQSKYQQQSPDETGSFWIEALGLFLGVWMKREAELEGYWLRWWNKSGNLLPWGSELVEQERQRAQQAEQKAAKLAQRLREMGINPE